LLTTKKNHFLLGLNICDILACYLRERYSVVIVVCLVRKLTN